MKRSSQMKRSLDECIVCHESLCDPMRTLPCLHSACLNCLGQLIEHSTVCLFFIQKDLFVSIVISGNCPSRQIGHAPFKCPVCRAVFEIPTITAAGNSRILAMSLLILMTTSWWLIMATIASKCFTRMATSSNQLEPGSSHPPLVFAWIVREGSLSAKVMAT